AIGQNAPSKEILKIIIRLANEEKTFRQPIYLFVICGKNEELRTVLERSVRKKVASMPKLMVHLCGFLEEKEMAQIDRISSVWITKPGGATCAELIETEKQMLYLFAEHHPWEIPNTLYLKKLRLAEELSNKKSLYKQVCERFHLAKHINSKKLPHSQWKDQVDSILNDD
ncbi:MAG TPA: hypothetical protein VN457_00985, partial [Chlamydiales bacterium]|nr:hypothetical protein [Chlamydiales bacterium]